jgi:hypothetical protein
VSFATYIFLSAPSTDNLTFTGKSMEVRKNCIRYSKHSAKCAHNETTSKSDEIDA